MKRNKLLIVFLLVGLNMPVFAVKIGLDSGHSIRELYKSGGAFYVKKYNPITDKDEESSYYSVAWPAGGLRFTTNSEGKENLLSSIYSVVGTYAMMSNSINKPNWAIDSIDFDGGATKLKWQDVRFLGQKYGDWTTTLDKYI